MPDGVLAPPEAALERQVFHLFPYPLLVVDGNGAVLTHNQAAAAVIEAGASRAEQLTCCTLLGCRTPDTVLADGCITELALAHGQVIPEVRVDVDTNTGPAGMWVSAAPLGEERAHVVLQLRPGIVRDRRRRTDPHWMSGPMLHIRTLGGTAVEAAEGAIGGDWLDQRTGWLLKYLVAERRRFVHVEEIGENVWPNAGFAIAGTVRYYVHALRRKLEPERDKRAPSAFIVSRASAYRLNLDLIAIDADEFEARANGGLAAAESDPGAAAEELERALTLYKGDFLADAPYADWAIAERQRLHDLACMTLRALARIRMRRRMIDRAVRCLERLATMQPYDEEVHRQLMELDLLAGHRSDAQRRYAALRSRTRRVFGRELEFTLADLTPAQPSDIRSKE